MRILLFNWRDLAHPRAGGAEVYSYNLARHWVALGHEVTWFTSAVENRPSVEDIDGVTMVRRGGRVEVYRAARRFYEREGVGRFDIVLDVVNTRPFLCPTFVRDVPVAALIFQVCREVWFYEAPLPAALLGRYYLERHWLKVYRDVPVMTISESSRISLARYGLSDVSVVPVGSDGVGSVRPEPKEAQPTVVFVGRLSANKRPSHALRAIEIARAQLPDMRAWVVGAGPQADRLRRRHGAGATYFGRVPDAEKLRLMSRAHAIVATSVREGWGMTISEAAAVGTPAIAYDVPGLCDSVRAAGGLLVPPTPRALGTQLGESLPQIMAGRGPEPVAAGVEPWSVVGDAVLARLEAALAARPAA